jgi:hypothetical protein
MKKNMNYLLSILLLTTCLLSCTKEQDLVSPKIKTMTITDYTYSSGYSFSEEQPQMESLSDIYKYTYNESRQLISAEKEVYLNYYTWNSKTSYFYEDDKVVKEIIVENERDITNIYTTVYTYDANGRCSSEAITFSSGQLPSTTYYLYDNKGWLIKDSISIFNRVYNVIERFYKDEFGCDTLVFDRCGYEKHIKYDSKHKQIESVNYDKQNNTVDKFFWTYEYDTKGRMTTNTSFIILEQNNVEISRGYYLSKYYYQSNDSIDSIIYMQAPDKNAELIKTNKSIYSYEYFEN